jgi:hypothetical protein
MSRRSGRAELPHPARPVNHSHALVAQCDPQLTSVSTALRRHCVDMGSGPDVPAMFPSDGRLTRKPPSLHRLRAGWPVRRLLGYYEALRRLPAHRPKLIGFAEDLPPCASDAFAPFAAHWQPQGPGPWGSADPRSRTNGGDRQASQVPGEPQGGRASFSDPGGTALPGQYGRAGAAPACAHGRGSHDETNFGAGWAGSGHTLSTLRPGGHPPRAQDSLPAVGQTLPGGLQGPLGSSERF